MAIVQYFKVDDTFIEIFCFTCTQLWFYLHIFSKIDKGIGIPFYNTLTKN